LPVNQTAFAPAWGLFMSYSARSGAAGLAAIDCTLLVRRLRSVAAVSARNILVGMLLAAGSLIPTAALAQDGRPSVATMHYYYTDFRQRVFNLTVEIEHLECVNPTTYWDYVGRIDGLDTQVFNSPLSHDTTGPFRGGLDRARTLLGRVRHCPGAEWTVTNEFPGSSMYLGMEILKTTGKITITERDADTGQVTNIFNDRKDPLGGGVVAGMNFTSGNSLQFGPFVSFDFPNIAVNHTFPGGSYLGARSNVEGTLGAKFGPTFSSAWLYGIAGVSVLNEKPTVNFVPVSSSSTATVPGATIGVGVSFQPAFLQGFGRPVSLFAEYQHTWWEDAHFNMPASSPFFNYSFRRDDDAFKLGFTVPLSAPPPAAAAPSYPVKALPPK
jgi:hypothetical protein